jgi:hypothetical protein
MAAEDSAAARAGRGLDCRGEEPTVARIPMDEFEEGTEIVRVYLAASLREAQAAEGALDAVGVDYAVEVEAFASPTALGSGASRQGAGFWVEPEDLDASAGALERAGLVGGLVQR